MKNYLRTQITLYEEDKNYPIWRRQERRSKYAVQLASWQLRSNSPKTSVRPSVRSLKYPLLTCTWVRLTNRNRFTACPSVRPSIRPSVRLSVRPSGEVSGHLLENACMDWPDISNVDVSWPSSELIFLILALFWLFWRDHPISWTSDGVTSVGHVIALEMLMKVIIAMHLKITHLKKAMSSN